MKNQCPGLPFSTFLELKSLQKLTDTVLPGQDAGRFVGTEQRRREEKKGKERKGNDPGSPRFSGGRLVDRTFCAQNGQFYTKNEGVGFPPLVRIDGFFNKMRITLCKMRIAFHARFLYNNLVIETNRSNA